ncbi:MAG: hypothetical protein C5B57_10205 [Blastocatellia bacterium]|nr:MAG: hypothetical protein C5B57_10205 [Blastocatellia bacterium]
MEGVVCLGRQQNVMEIRRSFLEIRSMTAVFAKTLVREGQVADRSRLITIRRMDGKGWHGSIRMPQSRSAIAIGTEWNELSADSCARLLNCVARAGAKSANGQHDLDIIVHTSQSRFPLE